MYIIKAETIITGDLDSLWNTEIDVNNWSTWNPHEEEARLDGALVTGAIGWSKPRKGPGTAWSVTSVVEKSLWASECKLPGGKLAGENTFKQLEDGRIHCTKTITVTGPLVPLFRFYFGRHIRHDMFVAWVALEGEAARRAAISSLQPGQSIA